MAMTVALLATGATTSGSTARPSCGPSDPTIAQRGTVRVFEDHTHGYGGLANPGLRGFVVACDSSSHTDYILTSKAATGTVLMPGSVSIAGHMVAYGYDDGTDDPEGIPTRTTVRVIDLTRQLLQGEFVALPIPAAPTGNVDLIVLGKVVRTVVNAAGAVAWISCEPGGNRVGFSYAVGRRARCQRPGRRAWVYSAIANKQYPVRMPTLLDDGRGIAPLSLRLAGSTVTWIDHGARRMAPLR